MEILATVNSVWDSIFQFLKPVLAALVGWLMTAFQGWIGTKAQNEQLIQLNQLETLTSASACVAVRATSANGLSASSSGLNQALSVLKTNLGAKTLDLLKKAKGLDDFGLDAYLKSHVDAAAHEAPPDAVEVASDEKKKK